jgi:hypothetical protein
MTVAAPSNIALSTGNGQNLVSWPAILGAITYTVQRSTDGVNFSTVSTPSVPQYLDASVSVGTQYWYQVSVTTGSGSSAYAASVPASIVPALPGQISLNQLRYFAQLKSDKLNSQYLTVDEWNFNINQSATELYDLLILKFGNPYFHAPALYISLTGLVSYPLPDGVLYSSAPAFYKLTGIDASISGPTSGANAGWVPLSRTNWSDRDNYTVFPGQAGALNNIYQMSYAIMGNQLFIFPQNINQTLRFWYVPLLSQMLLDTDMLPFSISGWSEYVITDAALKAMEKEESSEKFQMLASRKTQLLERINEVASKRDYGQPGAVSNTRRTVGDPGFSGASNGFNGGFFGSGNGG